MRTENLNPEVVVSRTIRRRKKAVNTEIENPAACGISTFAFIPGEIIASVEVSDGVMRVVKIIVLAKKTERGWVRVTPTSQYTAVFFTFDEA